MSNIIFSLSIVVISFFYSLDFDKKNNYDNFLSSKEINEEKISNDSIFTTNIIQGVEHVQWIDKQHPWNINILKIYLKNNLVGFQTVKSNDALEQKNEKLTQMIKRKSNDLDILGGINADFFNMTTGNIFNIQISNFQFVKGTGSKRSSLILSSKNEPYIGNIKFSGTLFCKNKKTISLDAVNCFRGTDSIVVYNSYWGKTTTTNGMGTEYSFKPISSWKINEKIKIVVLNKESDNSDISNDKAIISAHGVKSKFLNSNIKIGDTINIILGTIPLIKNIKESVGGLPQILKEGIDISEDQTLNEGGSKNFCTTRHPRTSVGFDKDKSRLYLVTVDGRQLKSVGMSLSELSNFMLSLGCYNALNLDGGGSTTMVVNNKIVNLPSDITGERSVANALLLIKNK